MRTREEQMAEKLEANKTYKKAKELEREKMKNGYAYVRMDKNTRVLRKPNYKI
jgi:hypothetical protein